MYWATSHAVITDPSTQLCIAVALLLNLAADLVPETVGSSSTASQSQLLTAPRTNGPMLGSPSVKVANHEPASRTRAS